MLTEDDDSGSQPEKPQACPRAPGEQVRAGRHLRAFYLDLSTRTIAGPGEEWPVLSTSICSVVTAETL